jgi:hypothetical protein
MVVKVARADLERIGDIDRRQPAFPLFVEEKEADFKYPVARFHGHAGSLTAKSDCETNFTGKFTTVFLRDGKRAGLERPLADHCQERPAPPGRAE